MKSAKTTEILIYIAFRWVQHIQKLTFSEQISIEITNCFWCVILDIMFWDFGASWCQNSRFWEPLGGQRCPKWRPRWPKWYPKACAAYLALTLFGGPRTDLLPRSLSKRSLAPFELNLPPLAPKSWIFARVFDACWWGFKYKFRPSLCISWRKRTEF